MQTVSDLLCQEDLVTTKRYLGINFEDHQTAYDLRAVRQRQIRETLRVNPLTSGKTPASERSWM